MDVRLRLVTVTCYILEDVLQSGHFILTCIQIYYPEVFDFAFLFSIPIRGVHFDILKYLRVQNWFSFCPVVENDLVTVSI